MGVKIKESSGKVEGDFVSARTYTFSKTFSFSEMMSIRVADTKMMHRI